MMNNIFYDQKQPLYKRATMRLTLNEFEIDTIRQILKDFIGKKQSLRISLEYYSVFGGIPYYYDLKEKLRLSKASLKMTISKLLIDQGAPLYLEGKEILTQEFGSEHLTYFAILESIAKGNNTYTKIAAYTGINSNQAAGYLQKLEKVYQIINKLQPLFSNRSKKTIYQIGDNFLHFWFRFVYSQKSIIELGFTKKLLIKISRDIPALAGFVFEDYCKYKILSWSDNNKIPFDITKIGRWWDKNTEVDIVADDKYRKQAIIVECKLSAKKISKKIVSQLISKAGAIAELDNRQKHYWLMVAEPVSSAIKKEYLQLGVKIVDEMDLI